MKPKKGYQLVLVIVTLAIWGLLIYRLVAPDELEVVDFTPSQTYSFESATLAIDTFELPSEIHDPFGNAGRRKTRTTVSAISETRRYRTVTKVSRKMIKATEEAKPKIDLQYLGYLQRNSDGREQILIRYKGKDKILPELDTLDGMILGFVSRDSLVFRFVQKRDSMVTIEKHP